MRIQSGISNIKIAQPAVKTEPPQKKGPLDGYQETHASLQSQIDRAQKIQVGAYSTAIAGTLVLLFGSFANNFNPLGPGGTALAVALGGLGVGVAAAGVGIYQGSKITDLCQQGMRAS